MQHANFLLFEVTVASPKIEDLTEMTAVKPQGEGVNREIPAMQVHFDAAAFHNGQRCGLVVELGAGSDQVEVFGEVIGVEPVNPGRIDPVLQVFPVEDPFRSAKAFVRHKTTAKLMHEMFRERHRVTFNHDVKILAGQLE